MFAQETIKVDEVGRELAAVREAIGSGVDVARFTPDALRSLGAVVTRNPGDVRLDLREVPRAARELIGDPGDEVRARFELPVPEDVLYLNRTHPFVAGLAGYVMDTALDPLGKGVARRCGVIRTGKVDTPHHAAPGPVPLPHPHPDGRRRRDGAAGRGLPDRSPSPAPPRTPSGSTTRPPPGCPTPSPRRTSRPSRRPTSSAGSSTGTSCSARTWRRSPASAAEELLDAHRRVRQATRQRGVRQRVEPTLPPDVLGVYVYLPKL